MEPQEKYEGWGSIKGYTPGEGYVYGDGTSDRQRAAIDEASSRTPTSTPPEQSRGLSKEEMAGPAGRVFAGGVVVSCLLVATMFAGFMRLGGGAPWILVLVLVAAWPLTVYYIASWFVQPERGATRPEGKRAVWIATAVAAYSAQALAGGFDPPGAALIVWPLGFYAIRAVWKETLRSGQ